MIKIFVKTKPLSREEKVQKIDEKYFKVSVKEPPVSGRANEAVRRAIAKYFDVAPSRVKIVSGHTSRQKVLEII